MEDDLKTEDAALSRLVNWFESAEENSEDARRDAERNRDYYDNNQLTADEQATLRKRGQPIVIINRIKPKIDYLCGFEAQTRTDPRGYPRTPADEEAAGAVTDALRFIADNTNLEQKFSNVWENILIEGFGGVELGIDPQTGDTVIEWWPWDRLFYDHHSRRHDFSDARFMGGVLWMDADAAVERWPKHKDEITSTIADDSSLSDTYEDRPAWQRWAQGKDRKRIRIVQMYYTDNDQWYQCIFTKGAKLESRPVIFKDQDGLSFCPMFLVSAYIDRNNNRYGLVSSMIGPQDEVNKRRSKALHLLNSRQTLGEVGAVDDVDLMKAEMLSPNGHVEVNSGFRFELLENGTQLQGHVQLLQEAKNEIELMGPNASLQGKQDGDPSGRAILASQQGGQIEIARLLDRHRDFKRRVYKGCWNLVRQFKDGEWWVRVTDDEKNVKFVGFNRPVTMADEVQKRLAASGMPPEQIEMTMAEVAADPIQAMQMQAVVRVENVPAEMNMDVVLEEVPDVANVQQEQFELLTKLAPAGIVFPPEIYIEMSALRNKRDLIDKLKGQNAPPPEQIEAQKKAQQVQIDRVVAQIQKDRASAIKMLAEADAVDGQMANLGTASQPIDIDQQSFDAPGVPLEDEALPAEIAPNGFEEFATPDQGQLPPVQ